MINNQPNAEQIEALPINVRMYIASLEKRLQRPIFKKKAVNHGLTKRQLETAEFIAAYTHEHHIAPTYDEIGTHLGLDSKSGVHRIITALEERNIIYRIPNRARCIAFIHPQNWEPAK